MSQVIEIPLNSAANANDEIQLTSDSSDDTAPHSKLIELSQVSLLKSYSVHYTIFDGHFLSVYSKTLFSKPKHYWLDLAYLEPSPQRVFKLDRPTFYTTGILLLAAVISILVSGFSSNPIMVLPMTIALICATLIAFLMLIYRSKDRVIFYSRYGRVNLLEFLINKPNRDAYREFIESISNAIHAVSSHQSSRHDQRLGAELRELRRIRDAGVLSPKIYEEVKKRFLSQSVNLDNMSNEGDDLKTDRQAINQSNLGYVSGQALAAMSTRMVAIQQNLKSKKFPHK